MLAVALLSGLAFAASACVDTPTAQQTGSTIGSELASGPDGGIPLSEGVDAGPWTTEEPGGEALTSLASAADIRAAVESSHGRTSDVAVEIRRFAPFPDISTPERASIEELRADVRNVNDSTGVIITAEVAFSADGTSDELVELYRADFAAVGWTESADRTGQSQGQPLRELGFAIPDTAYRLDDVLLTLAPAPSFDDAARTMVRMRYVEVLPVGDPMAERFLGWAAGVPIPAASIVTSAGIHTSSVGRNTLHYSLATYYDTIEPATVANQVRQSLPAGGFSERPTPLTGDATDNWVHLNSEEFDKAWISTQGIAGLPPSTSNPTKVNVDARVDFSPSAQ